MVGYAKQFKISIQLTKSLPPPGQFVQVPYLAVFTKVSYKQQTIGWNFEPTPATPNTPIPTNQIDSAKTDLGDDISNTPQSFTDEDALIESVAENQFDLLDESTQFSLEDTVTAEEETINDNAESLDDSDDDSSLPLGQGSPHNPAKEKPSQSSGSNDEAESIDSMEKAMIFVLQTDLKSLKATLKSKDSDIRAKEDQIVELQSKNVDLTRNKDKDEEMDELKAKVASFDDLKKSLENRIVRYGKIIMAQRRFSNEPSAQRKCREEKTLKEKNTMLKEYEKNIKTLVGKVSELQNITDEEYVEKIKEDLEDKKRELKKSKEELRKANERNKKLAKNVDDLNKKVSQLENENTRVRLINNQAKEAIQKSAPQSEPTSKSDTPKKTEMLL